MLDGAMIVWFTLSGLAVAFVVGDSLFNGVTSWVQRMAWILVTHAAARRSVADRFRRPGAFLTCQRSLPLKEAMV